MEGDCLISPKNIHARARLSGEHIKRGGCSRFQCCSYPPRKFRGRSEGFHRLSPSRTDLWPPLNCHFGSESPKAVDLRLLLLIQGSGKSFTAIRGLLKYTMQVRGISGN